VDCARISASGVRNVGAHELSEIGSDVAVAAVVIPAEKFVPVIGSEILFDTLRPSDVVPAVVGRQIHPGLLVVGRVDRTAGRVDGV